MILDNCDEDKPLLIHENGNVRGLPEAIRSLMLVPLNIRKKVFGVLAVSSLNGDVRFSEKDLYYMSFMTNKAAYAIENVALYENIYENLLATLYAFVGAIEARDPYTEQHSNRVTRIAIALCQALGGSQEEQDILNVAGQLHDIGKIGIRDDILLKPGRLTDEEFSIIKEHPVIGANIVERLGLWDREKTIIKCHHERFDGKGYPDGLAGENIPMLGRISPLLTYTMPSPPIVLTVSGWKSPKFSRSCMAAPAPSSMQASSMRSDRSTTRAFSRQ